MPKHSHWNNDCRHETEEAWILCEILNVEKQILEELRKPKQQVTAVRIRQTGG